MVSPSSIETAEAKNQSPDPHIISTPRISFSSDFLDDDDDRNFISITPNTSLERSSMSCIHDHNDRILTKLSLQDEIRDDQKLTAIMNKKKNIQTTTTGTTTTTTTTSRGGTTEIMGSFEFLSSHNSFTSQTTMLTADELFFEGKLLPFWQMHHHTVTTTERQLGRINLGKQSSTNSTTTHLNIINTNNPDTPSVERKEEQQPTTITHAPKSYRSLEEPRIWYIDDDPSPRPPKCTVLWKELLRLKKNRPQQPPTSLSPSSSSSSTSSSGSSIGDQSTSSSSSSTDDTTTTNTAAERMMSTREKHMRRIKKGLERTKSAASIRIRPMVNVPICTTTTTTTGKGTTTTTTAGGGASSFPPPLFPRGKGSGRPAAS